jgi:predicted small secreted protein
MKPDCAALSQLRRFALLIAIRVATPLLLSASLAQDVGAQRAETIRVGLRLRRDSTVVTGARKLSDPLAMDSTSTRASRTVRGALIGAGVGVATGLVVAVISTNDESITDHSEDGLAYAYFTAVFGLVGLVVGGIVGFARN